MGFNLAVQADSEEQPVSFDDLPSSTHVILNTNKHRAKIPSRRRPTGRGHAPQENGNNGHGENGNGHVENSHGHVGNGNGHDRLALPVREENDYDGDESEMSYSHIKRGRRSIKKKQPPNSAPMRTGIPLSVFAHKASDSDDKEIVHSNKPCDSSDSASKDRLEAEKRLKEEKQREEEARSKKERGVEETKRSRRKETKRRGGKETKRIRGKETKRIRGKETKRIRG